MKHYKRIDLDHVLNFSSIIILIIALILQIINMYYLHNDTIRGFVFGIDLAILLEGLIRVEVSEKNLKLIMEELERSLEDFDDKNSENM